MSPAAAEPTPEVPGQRVEQCRPCLLTRWPTPCPRLSAAAGGSGWGIDKAPTGNPLRKENEHGQGIYNPRNLKIASFFFLTVI